jgi:hypothetical protein
MATLGFRTEWPEHMGGGYTQFVDKIWSGLIKNEMFSYDVWTKYSVAAERIFGHKFIENNFPLILNTPKLHTIRPDNKGLWKPGRKIHPVIFNRTINRFQFAPVLECKAVQKIQIIQCEVLTENKTYKRVGEIFIDNQIIEPCMYKTIAINDGFDGTKHFFQWFNEDFEGKIIHWTTLKY